MNFSNRMRKIAEESRIEQMDKFQKEKQEERCEILEIISQQCRDLANTLEDFVEKFAKMGSNAAICSIRDENKRIMTFGRWEPRKYREKFLSCEFIESTEGFQNLKKRCQDLSLRIRLLEEKEEVVDYFPYAYGDINPYDNITVTRYGIEIRW